MLKKCLSFLLVISVVHLINAAPVSARTKAEKDARFAGEVRANVIRLGTGEAARVKVTLRDKTKLEGYVAGAGADSFTVVDSKTGASTSVAYPQVKQVKGNNLSTGAKVAIGVGIAVLIIAIVVASFDIGPVF
jgi:hypothetical protein